MVHCTAHSPTWRLLPRRRAVDIVGALLTEHRASSLALSIREEEEQTKRTQRSNRSCVARCPQKDIESDAQREGERGRTNEEWTERPPGTLNCWQVARRFIRQGTHVLAIVHCLQRAHSLRLPHGPRPLHAVHLRNHTKHAVHACVL